MKIIISRKGFDSSNGGIPSPIFRHADGTFGMYSLPIPLERTTCSYADIQWNGTNLDDLISSLRAKKRKKLPDTPHLDPDLFRGALKSRHRDWRPIFGQSGGQETQLQNMQVRDPCDLNHRPLFLFFGWYREIERCATGYRYVKNAPHLHAFFGWLQVEKKLTLEDRETVKHQLPWAAPHPHVACDYYDGKPNAIYIAPRPGSTTDRLILAGRDTGLPAAGFFARFNPDLHTLTMKGRSRSVWRLPAWFYEDGEPKLGMHNKISRWSPIEGDNNHIRLKSVDVGQEFVLDSRSYKQEEEKVLAWVEAIVRAGLP